MIDSSLFGHVDFNNGAMNAREKYPHWMASRRVGFVEYRSDLFPFLALTTRTTIIEQLTIASDNPPFFSLMKEIDRDQERADTTARSTSISRII